MARVATLLAALSVLLGACRTLSDTEPQLAPAAVCGTANLAQGKPATASSSENPGVFGAAAAVDGDAGTRWSSVFSDPQWLQVDLGSVQPLCQVVLQWEAAYGKSFQLQVSNDGTAWSPVATVTNAAGGTQTLELANAGGRYVRLNGTERGTPYGYSLFEFRVFGNSAGPPPPPPSGIACFFENDNYGGASFCADVGSGWVGSAWNDRISSVRLQSGYRVELFNDANYGGAVKPLTGDAASLPDFDNRASSFKVVGTGGSSPTGPTVTISGNKRAYASSTQGREADAARAIDGDLATRWASGSSPRAWLMVDLGAPARIDRVELEWERAWSSRYFIEVSNDRATWTQAGPVQTNPVVRDGVTPNPPAAEYRDNVALNLTETYRFVRLNSVERGWSAGDGSQYGVSLFELAVYGAGGQDNPAPVGGAPLPGSGPYTLRWADEFDSGADKQRVDPGKWTYELGDGCDRGLCGWGNGERQYYTDSLDNVFRQGGLLNIQLRKNDAGRAYTSGRVTTQGNYEFAYGRVAARIRMDIPATAAGAKDGPVGVWGAFWLLGFDVNAPYVGWPSSGEIDIMENIGYPWWFSAALHGPGYNGGGSLGESFNKRDTGGGIVLGDFPAFSATDWHTYEAEWDANQIVFKVDDRPFRTLTRAEVESRGEWVFNKPNFIILNVAYGGAYPSAYLNNPQNFTGPRTEGGLAQLAENNFPHTMQVDWVRVYGRQ